MKTIEIGANPFSYDDTGEGEALLLLSGWCQDHRLFKTLAPELARTHRVIRFDWRGHGEDRTYDGDFTIDDQAADVVAFAEKLGLERVLPISTSHGGWANLEFADRMGAERVPRSVVIDWIMVSPDESFFTKIDDIQDRQNWESGRKDFFNHWIGDTDNQDIIDHVNDEMAGFDYEMWARSGREIAKAYRKWGNPMSRMNALAQTRPITHIFSQPFEEDYLRAQRDFAANHPWFVTNKLEGKTHFPTLEQPRAVADTVRAFLA
jgi:pimeloyl-ACP methyl ester carboxylesterase